jgi:hypothetical protein
MHHTCLHISSRDYLKADKGTEIINHNVTNMTIDRQRWAKHVPELYAVNKNRFSLLDNGYGYRGIRQVPVTTRTTTVLEPFQAVISTRFAQGYKKRPDDTERPPSGGRFQYLHRSPASRRRRRKGNPVPGYNWATLFLEGINTETWPSRLGE